MFSRYGGDIVNAWMAIYVRFFRLLLVVHGRRNRVTRA
jgi:hypothetical protein